MVNRRWSLVGIAVASIFTMTIVLGYPEIIGAKQEGAQSEWNYRSRVKLDPIIITNPSIIQRAKTFGFGLNTYLSDKMVSNGNLRFLFHAFRKDK